MEPAMFETPVTILIGLGIPTHVNTVMRAYQLLTDWRSSSQNAARDLTLRGCRAALAGTSTRRLQIAAPQLLQGSII